MVAGQTIEALSLEQRRGTAHEHVPPPGNFSREVDFDGTPHASARWTAYVPGSHALALSEVECDQLEGAVGDVATAGVFGDHGQYVAHVPGTASGVVQRIADAAFVANVEWWRFDLDVVRHVQVVRYVTGPGMVAHTDGSPLFPRRKLSAIVPLSHPDEYEGGRLEMLHAGEPSFPPAARGSVIVLPAYLLHRVTPITAGQRKTLTMFIEGDPFR